MMGEPMAKAQKPNSYKKLRLPRSPQAGQVFRGKIASGNNIRNWRLFRGLERQLDLADATKAHDPKGRGLDRVIINRLESGADKYHQGHIELIARTLRVSERDLIGTNPYDAGDIFAVCAGLSEAGKAAVLKYAKRIRRV